MIFTDRTITVKKGASSIDDTIVLYRGDKEVEIRFTLNESSPFRFGIGAEPNIIEKTEAAYGQLVIKTPNDLPSIFSEIVPTNEGKIIFTITAEMIDEITEVGNYTFQIRLLDESMNSRATIPEVINGIEIREPIAIEDMTNTNEVGVATVGYAMTTAGTTEDVFDSQGNYNKTTWGTGDRITAAKLNKMEAGIDGVNKKVASAGTSGSSNINDTTASTTTTYSSNKIESIKEDLSSQIKEIANLSLTKHTDGKVYIKKQDGTLIGTGIEIGGGNVDLSKITMSMDGQTLKLMNDGVQIATVEIPTAVVTDEQLTSIIQAKIDDGTISTLGIDDGSVTLKKLATDVIGETSSTEVVLKEVDMGLKADTRINNGVESSASGMSASDYILLDGSTFYFLEPDFTSNLSGNPFAINYYDTDKTYLSTKYFTKGKITPPDGAVYMRFSSGTDNYAYATLYKTSTVSYKQLTSEILLPNFKTGEMVKKTLTFTDNDILTGKVVNSSAIFDSVGKNTVKYVKVIPGKEYKVHPVDTTNTSPGTQVVFYDIGKRSVSQTWVKQGATFTVPDGCYYLMWYYDDSFSTSDVYIEGTFYDNDHITYEPLILRESNFDTNILTKLRSLLGLGAGGNIVYNALDYGISTTSEDNTSALQTLVDTVNTNGGGIIYFPVGTYTFKSCRETVSSGNMEAAVWAKSKVSIMGESITGTVLKMTGDSACGKGFALFAYRDLATPIEGCTYSNFTVEASECTITEYNHQGKAFYMQGIKNCVFRDLILKNTPATALGIDHLIDVTIDSVICENCGREWVYPTGNGGAGIGIGTGNYANENYVIRNCICIGCGHYGIFLEDQGIFASVKTCGYAKGALISNNICRNNRYGGIGIRGGEYTTISNNICYNNNDAGIEVDYMIRNCDIIGNTCYANKQGIAVKDTTSDNVGAVTNINISNNRVTANTVQGISIDTETTTLMLANNIIQGNTNGITFVDGQVDTIIKNNIITDNKTITNSYFTGNTNLNELL